MGCRCHDWVTEDCLAVPLPLACSEVPSYMSLFIAEELRAVCSAQPVMPGSLSSTTRRAFSLATTSE